MNLGDRQDDRPRVASFLIDDILAPQSLSTVVQCPTQRSHSANDVDFRHLSSGHRDRSSFCNRTLPSSCLQCYGNSDHVSFLKLMLYVKKLPKMVGTDIYT